MSQSTDGIDTTARQHGAKTVSLPLQGIGNYYATAVRRQIIATPATAYSPVVGARTTYTQQLKYSDDLSQAAWTNNASTATASAATDPEGGSTACKLAEDATNAAHNAQQAMTVASGALAFGALCKAGERGFARLRINNGTDGNLGIAVFNLITGALVSGAGTIKQLLNGWWWCYVTGTATVANSTAIIDLTADGSTFSYAGSAGSGIYVWRATAYLSSSIGPAIASTSVTRAVTSPAVDTDDPTAFIVDEQEPDSALLELGVARWTRSYANVPAQTVHYSSRAITKPVIPNQATTATSIRNWIAAGTEITSAIKNSTGYWSNDNRVFSPYKAISVIESTLATAGNFTLTYKTSTTANIAYNANNATINAALNGLASVVADGLTFSANTDLTVSNGVLTLTITAGTTTTAVTMDVTGLTVSNGVEHQRAFSDLVSSTVQYISLACTISVTSHGFDASKALVLIDTANGYVIDANHFAIYDANTVQIPQTYSPVNAYASATIAVQYLRNYTPGATVLGSKITESFYLPGFTPGVNSAADIPITAPAISDADVIAAVLSAGTYKTVDFSGPDFWLGPIYRTVKTELNFDSF